MKTRSLENAESLLDEYTEAVASLTAARIDAGCCRTRADFLLAQKREGIVEELRAQLMAAMGALARY